LPSDSGRVKPNGCRKFEPAPGAVAVLRGPKHVLEIFNPANTALVGSRDVIPKLAH